MPKCIKCGDFLNRAEKEKGQDICTCCQTEVTMEPEKSIATHCPKCGWDWEAHEFAVPAPYCPGGEEDAAANRAFCARFMARVKEAEEEEVERDRLDVTNVKERGFTGTYEEINAMYAPLLEEKEIKK